MTRKMATLAVVVMVAAGASTALVAGAGNSGATGETLFGQDTETTTAGDGTVTENETTAGGETTTALGAGASLTVLNQTGNGSVVTVERAVLPEGGFVVIHDAENVTGDYATAGNVSVGSVLGNSTYLEPGDTANVRIELDQPLEEGQTVVAMAHRDTNDNQRYDFPEADGPYTRDGGPVVETAYFILDATGGGTAGIEATGNRTANITFDDQIGNGSVVHIGSVAVSEGGFVSVRTVDNGTVGDVVGNTSYLEPGQYENVSVRLDEPLSESRNLVAMVHPDVDDNQVFDYPGEDQPYLAAGGTLSDPAFISVPTPAIDEDETTGTGDDGETTTASE